MSRGREVCAPRMPPHPPTTTQPQSPVAATSRRPACARAIAQPLALARRPTRGTIPRQSPCAHARGVDESPTTQLLFCKKHVFLSFTISLPLVRRYDITSPGSTPGLERRSAARGAAPARCARARRRKNFLGWGLCSMSALMSATTHKQTCASHTHTPAEGIGGRGRRGVFGASSGPCRPRRRPLGCL